MMQYKPIDAAWLDDWLNVNLAKTGSSPCFDKTRAKQGMGRENAREQTKAPTYGSVNVGPARPVRS